MEKWLFYLIGLLVLLVILEFIYQQHRHHKLRELYTNTLTISVSALQQWHLHRFHDPKLNPWNIRGTVVVCNQRRGLYMVVSGRNMLSQAYDLFYHGGPKRFNRDFNRGDSFTIRLLPLSVSPYHGINSLENGVISSLHLRYRLYHN